MQGAWLFLAAASSLALTATNSSAQALPPDEEGSLERLDASPRHGEWVTFAAGEGDEVKAWVVYPERGDAAPVVVVIHEIYGLTDWIRAVTDQLAADGFIAIAPDLLTGKGPDGGDSDSMDRQARVAAIRSLDRAEVNQRLRATAEYGTSLPAAADQVGSVGFCWGGSSSFLFAVDWQGLDAAVVYYGSSPATESLSSITAPVLGLYGGNDNRVNATIPDADAEMKRLGITYEIEIYDGAGHGFLRNQQGQDGANMAASEGAWPRTVRFFQEHLER